MAVDVPPPWASEGLPSYLTSAHFDVAGDVVALGRILPVRSQFGPVGLPDVRPLVGLGGYFQLYGAEYPANQQRLMELLRTAPLHVTVEGQQLYPAILVPDPTQQRPDAAPVGLCAVTGFVGSVYGVDPLWRAHVDYSLSRRRFWATRVLVGNERELRKLRAWFPTTDRENRSLPFGLRNREV